MIKSSHIYFLLFGAVSMFLLVLFLKSGNDYFKFRYNNPLRTDGIVIALVPDSVNEEENLIVSIKDDKGQEHPVRNKIGNITSGLVVGDKVQVLYFESDRSDAVIDTFWDIEDVALLSFVLLLVFVIVTYLISKEVFQSADD